MELLREKENLKERELFNKYSSPDAIVIDGRRGTGKTTHLLTLKTKVERENRLASEVKVLDVIDPTNISDRIDILQVFLANLQEELELYKDSMVNQPISYRRRCGIETPDIHSLRRRIRKLSQELIKLNSEKFLETEQEAAYTYKVGNDIPFEIHKLARDICRLFNKRALILPIDDVDMNLRQSMKVINFVKDNFLTPYIIPIVALDLSQALAIIKKEKYGFFDIEPWEKPSSKTFDLRFLDKLPAEWLQKAFSPSKRIILPDIYNIYLDYLSKDDYRIYFTYGTDKKIKLEFSEAISLMLSLVYEWNNVNVRDPASYFVKNYLEGRSVRDFLNDLRALMRGLVKKLDSAVREGEEYVIEYDLSELAERFKPYSLYKEETPQDTISWFWKRFIEVFKRRKKEIDIRNLRDTVREVLKIADEENEIVPRLEKSYYRILIQKIYTESIRIYLKPEKGNSFIVSKMEFNGESFLKVYRVVSVNRMVGLAYRTIIPAYIFLWAVKKKYISSENFDFSEFSELYSSLKREILNESIKEFYRNILVWHLKYPSGENKVAFCSIPFWQKKLFERTKAMSLVKYLLRLALNEKNKGINNLSEFFTEAYSPDVPTVPHIYFSPFSFWFSIFVERTDEEFKVVIKPPWSFGIELMRDVVSRYTENLVDGLFNFNKTFTEKERNFKLKFESILDFSKLYAELRELRNEIKKEAEEKEKGNLSESFIAKKASELRDWLDSIQKECSSTLGKSICEDIKKRLNNLASTHLGEINYSKSIDELSSLLKQLRERLRVSLLEMLFGERAVLRAVISATYLPIHHVIVRLLQYAGVGLCKDMYSGYIRYGFRPQYEDDIHSLRWDIVIDLNCLREKAGNSKGISDIIESIKNYLLDESSFAIKFAFHSDKSGRDEDEGNEESLEGLKRRLVRYYLEFYKAVMERDENKIEEKLKELVKTYNDFVRKSGGKEEG